MANDQRQSSSPSPGENNRLIDRLPRSQRRAVLAACDVVELDSGIVVCEAGDRFRHVYFPLRGAISMTGKTSDGHSYEASSVGREGMVGLGLIFGVNRSVQQGIVRTSCQTLRITTRGLRLAMQAHPAFHRILQHHLYQVLEEISQTVGCVQFHHVDQRLARALLVSHDRVTGDTLRNLTQRILADMLGVQRGSVTLAAARLQSAGVIRYSRGTVFIMDRDALVAAACDCYRPGREPKRSSNS